MVAKALGQKAYLKVFLVPKVLRYLIKPIGVEDYLIGGIRSVQNSQKCHSQRRQDS